MFQVSGAILEKDLPPFLVVRTLGTVRRCLLVDRRILTGWCIVSFLASYCGPLLVRVLCTRQQSLKCILFLTGSQCRVFRLGTEGDRGGRFNTSLAAVFCRTCSLASYRSSLMEANSEFP